MLKFNHLSLRTVQDALHVLELFDREGIEDGAAMREQLQSVVARYTRRKPEMEKRSWVAFKIMPCPECGTPLLPQSVNVSSSTRIGGGWKTSLLCRNIQCRHVEYSKRHISAFTGVR